MIADGKDNSQELFPVVDEEGNILSAATRGECHGGFNSQGELYLQKRPAWKDIQPDKWDTAVGGHVDLGESIHQALLREVREELGITDFEPQALPHYVFQSERERELVFPFRTIYDGAIHPSKETDGGRFWSIPEIEASLGKDVFTPNFESEYQKVIKSH